MRCGLNIIGGVGQLVVVGIRPRYQGLWVGLYYSKRLEQNIRGGVGLVSALRLGHSWWCRIG